MKTIITLAALALTTLTSFAQESTPDAALSSMSNLTRAEVRGQLTAAVAHGMRTSTGEFSPESLPSSKPALTRSQARMQLDEAIANGHFPSSGEASAEPLFKHTMAMANHAKTSMN